MLTRSVRTGWAIGAYRTGVSDAPEGIVVDLDWRTSATVVAGLLVLFSLFELAQSARQALIWVAVGTLLALSLDPLVRALATRLRCRRGVAVTLVLVLVVGAVSSVLVVLGPAAVREANGFRRDLPSVVAQLGAVPVVGPWLERNDVPARLESWLQELPSRLSGDATPIADLARSIFGGALAASAIVLVTVTLLLDGERLVRGARRLVPFHLRDRADRVGGVLYRTVGRYFAGSVLIAVLNGLAVLVAGLALGLPLAPLAALWAAITNLIPQIGGFLGGSVFVLLGFSQGAGTGVACLAAFLTYQQFENHVLQPTVVGQAVDLSPPVTMMAALVGASTAGVPGALVAVPLVGTIKAVAREVRPPPGGGALPEHPALLDRLARLARIRRRPAHRPPGSPGNIG